MGRRAALLGRRDQAGAALFIAVLDAESELEQLIDTVIVVVEDGRIVERGTHRELLAGGGPSRTWWTPSWKTKRANPCRTIAPIGRQGPPHVRP